MGKTTKLTVKYLHPWLAHRELRKRSTISNRVWLQEEFNALGNIFIRR
jgi:hypothetical protein